MCPVQNSNKADERAIWFQLKVVTRRFIVWVWLKQFRIDPVWEYMTMFTTLLKLCAAHMSRHDLRLRKEQHLREQYGITARPVAIRNT